MPVEELFTGKELVRRVTTVRGEVKFIMKCMPRFNYGRSRHSIEVVSDTEVIFTSEGEDKTTLRLLSSVRLQVYEGDIIAEFTLLPGETADFFVGAY